MNETDNFIWKLEWLLGAGGFGSVYKAMNKESGKIVAVKEFKNDDDVSKEERVLHDLKHENIIQLIACEKVHKTNKRVLILEYCNGKDLGDLLSDPENANGFSEIEFLQILHDLSAGIEYLRSKEITHRDLKPANIVRCVRDDGRSIYKIVDFGLAKQIGNFEYFTSWVGTPIYMPAICMMELMGLVPKQKRTAMYDIRLMGVTLYQLITGQLPFYAADLNFVVLQAEVLKRPADVIAVVQRVAGGPIEYFTTLPSTCLLSPFLCKEMEIVLQKALQEEEELRLPFVEYFERVKNILLHKSTPVFYVNKGLLVILHSKDQSGFRETLANLMNVDEQQFITIYDGTITGEMINENHSIQHFQDLSYEKPVIVISVENDIQETPASLFSEFKKWWTQSSEIPPKIDAVSKLFEDFDVTKIPISDVALKIHKYCCIAYAVQRLVQKIVMMPKYLIYTLTIMRSFLSGVVSGWMAKLQNTVCALNKLSDKIEQIKERYSGEIAEKMLEDIASNFSSLQEITTQKLNYFESLDINELNSSIVLSDINPNACIAKVTTYVKEMVEQWETFQSYAKKGVKNEEKILLKLEKMKFDVAKDNLLTLADAVLKNMSTHYFYFKNSFTVLQACIVNFEKDKDEVNIILQKMNSLLNDVSTLKWLNIHMQDLMVINMQQLEELMKSSQEESIKTLKPKLNHLLEIIQSVIENNIPDKDISLLTDLNKEKEIMEDFIKRAKNMMS